MFSKSKQNFFLIVFISIYSISIAIGANTVIQLIAGNQKSTNSNSYVSQSISTLDSGDLKFVNKDNDAISIGDYFSGYYYDSAYGVFQTDRVSQKVSISSTSSEKCSNNTTHRGYKLQGYSYNPEFGFMNFSYNELIYSYICLPTNQNDETLTTYLGGYAYSPYIGFQNFDGIFLDSSVDFSQDHLSDGRYIKVNGIVASQNSQEALQDQFSDDVRIVGKITKSTLKKDIKKNIYDTIRGIPSTQNGTRTPQNLFNTTWDEAGGGQSLLNGSVLAFIDVQGQNITLNQENNITGVKTLMVEGGNIYIRGNLRGNGVLGLIALEKDGKGGNIYIDREVTDIHAIMYAEKSLVSYNENSGEYDGSTQASVLANQLYIFGSVFSENTIGGSVSQTCPYFTPVASCTLDISKKYDLNLLRRYILVQPVDSLGNPVGDMNPQFNGKESYMGDTSNTNTQTQKPGYRKYPFIIEYNSAVQQTPPPFFGG